MRAEPKLEKVRFATDPEGFGGGAPERLWARRLPSEQLYFELQNSPFFAKGVSYLDVVEAVEDSDCPGEFDYRRTLSGSGHSTYRILVPKNSEHFVAWWNRLSAYGCTYEYADLGAKLLYAVDVPSEANIFDIYAILEEGEAQDIWLFDEGHCGHPIDDSSKR